MDHRSMNIHLRTFKAVKKKESCISIWDVASCLPDVRISVAVMFSLDFSLCVSTQKQTHKETQNNRPMWLIPDPKGQYK